MLYFSYTLNKNTKGGKILENILLQGKSICKSYANNGTQNHILNMLDIKIYEGDFTVAMGASGAGKSTLLYTLSGMDKATSGEIIYKGEDISKYNESNMTKLRSKDFGFVFQQAHLVSNLTLLENVLVTGYLNKEKSAKEVKEEALALFEKMNITDAMNRLPAAVSGGEAQRAAIARAVINKPSIVFADEPTGALNKKNSIEVLKLLSDINKEGQSILLVTHDIKAAIRAARILYIEDGKVMGELKLKPYADEDAKDRETQVNSWLSSMEW